MELGSFLELELRDTGEYFNENNEIARLNSGRCGIFHSLGLLKARTIRLPYYLCPTVKSFLQKKGIEVKPYFIDEEFEPILPEDYNSDPVLVVNYFGILAQSKLNKIRNRFKNVIIDNCPAFFSVPMEDCYCIYSTRKFFGVPDGCYVIGLSASENTEAYSKDFSSETSAFLLKRIEKGCSHVYNERMENEKRIDQSDVMIMSDLTRRMLKSIDYESIRRKRLENFYHAHALFRALNLLDPEKYMDPNCVPLVYPLLYENVDVVSKLKANDIYTGRWWNNVLNEVPTGCFEAYLSTFMVPIPIDQRYGENDIEHIFSVFKKYFIT